MSRMSGFDLRVECNECGKLVAVITKKPMLGIEFGSYAYTCVPCIQGLGKRGA